MIKTILELLAKFNQKDVDALKSLLKNPELRAFLLDAIEAGAKGAAAGAVGKYMSR